MLVIQRRVTGEPRRSIERVESSGRPLPVLGGIGHDLAHHSVVQHPVAVCAASFVCCALIAGETTRNTRNNM